ncbi:MAG: hypothetical protein HOK71_17555 [Planctomycetaceae bacterium]|nr:hypothetical protein [Planctomycetaceae bacterium]MBT6486457.1 hypothetical protein [Planctomycetaceae bacterium]
MAEPSPTDLIALLARFAAEGLLETPQVLAAIGALAGESEESDGCGAAALLEDLSRQSEADAPAIGALIGHVKQMRLDAARRFHRQRKQGQVDPVEFEKLLGDLPLGAPLAWSKKVPSINVLESATSLARDRRFLSTRHDEAPALAAELQQQYEQTADEVCAVLGGAGGHHRLLGDLIDEVRRRLGDELFFSADESKATKALIEQLSQIEIEATASRPTELRDGKSSDSDTLRSLSEQFHSAASHDERRQVLDRVCTWPTAESAEVILRLVGTESWAQERAELILISRFGGPPVAGWTGWENALRRAARRSQQELHELLCEEPAELLLIWASQQNDINPEILAGLERYCATHVTRVDAETFAARWTDVLTAAEFNALVGVDFQVVEPIVETPIVETVETVMPQTPRAAKPLKRATPQTAPVVTPAPPPPPPTPTIWQEHIQPFLTENWYMVAGVVMVVAGASLISVYFWDTQPIVKFTLMPALLAGFTFAVAMAGSWIERQDAKFRGTAAVLRGAAIALLPINFMVVSLLAGEPKLESKALFVAMMGVIYLLLFGWGLRSWCQAVHEPLGIPLGGSLLAINSLVMIGPLSETLAQRNWGGLPVLVASGFYAGFALVAWVSVRFAGRMLTPELAAEKRVPWFVGGTLAVAYLQVFGWVHFQSGALPHVSTYALLVIVIGWLVLFAERRAIELEDRGERLGGESFLGYALILLGVMMGSFNEYVRIAAFAVAGVAWLYQAVRRNDELQHWIGLTLLALAGASVAMLEQFPRDPWLPAVGLVLALVMGGLNWLGRQWEKPHLSRAATGMQPALALLTAVVAMLAQWHFRSTPLNTACYLLAVVAIFAWRASRDDELRWVHSAMAVVGLSLPYLGCVDMLGRNLRGNTMVFGLAVTSFGWLGVIWLTKSKLLLQARSTVLMVYGSIAVAAMVLRVLFEGVPPADVEWWHQWMDYFGPLLMAALLTIATYYTRSLLPAAMATVIGVILFPGLRARFHEAFETIGWGTGLGSSCSALGLVLTCFALKKADWLKQLDEGDLFLGRTPFPIRRFDHTLFTWPLAASALFLIVRVDSWNFVRKALPDGSIADLMQFDLGLIPMKMAVAVGLTGVTWTLLAVFFRHVRGVVVGTHLGWISLLAGLMLGNELIETPYHWSWPFLATGLILQGLEVLYLQLRSNRPWIDKLLKEPTRQVLGLGSVLLSVVCVIVLVNQGQAEFAKIAALTVFVAVQLARSALVTRQVAFGGFLFVLVWISLLSVTTPGETVLLARLSIAKSLWPTLWLLMGIQAVHLGMELAQPVYARLRPLLVPFLAGAGLLNVVLILIGFFDAVTAIDVSNPQRCLLLLVTLAAARIHGSAWLGLLALLQTYVIVNVFAGDLLPVGTGANGAGEWSSQIRKVVENLMVLAEPWRCAALGLSAAVIGETGRLVDRRHAGVLVGPFAQPGFRSPHVAWLFAPAVTFALFATAYHSLDASYPRLRDVAQQLWAPFLAAGSLAIIAWSWRSQTLAWLAASVLGLGNIHCMRVFLGDSLRSYGLSEIHLIALGLVAALLELTAIRELWRRDRVTVFVNRASLAGAALVLMLICMNYVTHPGLGEDDFPWQRFVVSGVMAYIAGLYFRHQARHPAAGEESTVDVCEAGYHFGVTLAIWCASLLALQSVNLLTPTIAFYALAVPIAYFYGRAEQGLAAGFAYARQYRNTASVLSFAILALWASRGALHFMMFPDEPFEFLDYHYNAPFIMLLSLVMLRLHGLEQTAGGTRNGWLAFYGGLAMIAGSFFTLTALPKLRLLDHPIAAAWAAIALAHMWTLLSQQRSPLRSFVQQIGRIDGPDWFGLRRSWGVCLLIAAHVAVLWGLLETLGLDAFQPAERLAAPLILGAASILIHQGIIRRSGVYFLLAAIEIVLALHAGFVINSYLPKEHVVWVILGLWAAGLLIWEFASRHVQARKLGTTAAVLAGLTMAHILFHHHPDSTAGLWAFAAMSVLAAFTPRSTCEARTGEETAAAGLLLIVPTWLVFFKQTEFSGGLQTVLKTWPLLATTAAVFATGSACRAFQVWLLPQFDAWQRTRPRLFDQTLSLAGKSGMTINSSTLWFCFVMAVVAQLLHYGRPFATREIVLLCTLYAGYSVAWFYEGQLRRTMSAYIVLQLCVVGFFAVLRRQLMLTTDFWSPEYDVWVSLVVSFSLCGAKQMIDVRPREIRIPLMGSLLALPVVALIWVLYNKMGSDVALLVVGLHSLMFTFLGKDDRESPYHIVAVGGFVAFVLIFFWSQLELRVFHAFVIPVGLGVLVLLQLFRGRIDIDTRNRTRLVTMVAMLASAGYYALVDDRHPVAFNLTLIVLCLLSMGLGSFLRVRMYLVLGFAALLVDVASIVFKVIRAADQTAQRAAIGALLLVIGIGLIAGAIYYKTHRDKINDVIDRWRKRLGAWE